MQSPEEFVLSGLTPTSEPVSATVELSPAIALCGDHARPNCLDCRERIQRAQEVASARRKGSGEPSAEAAIAAPMTEPTNADAPIVVQAKNYADFLARLDREQRLLLAAEARVVSLTESIANLKQSAEEARQRLFEAVTATN